MPKFPFATNEPFWSDTGPEDQTLSKAAGGLFGGALVVGGIAGGFYEFDDGTRLMDQYYRVAKTVGNMSPYGLFASVRAAEAMSPFLSEKMQLSRGGGAWTDTIHWEGEFLHSNDTKRWVAAATGKTVEELDALEFGTDEGHRMSFKRTDKYGRGTLSYNDVVLSDDIMLYERDLASDAFSTRRTVNQFAEALGTVIAPDVKLTNTFTTKPNPDTGFKTATHSYLPGPSLTGPTDTVADALRRFSYPRTVAAFEAQRFNQAIRTIGESVPIVGEHLARFLKSEDWGIRNTTALKQWGRYTGFAMKLGGLGLMLKTADHYQQKADGPITSALISGGTGFITSSLLVARHQRALATAKGEKYLLDVGGMAKSKIVRAATLGAAILPILMPGFDKGVVAGLSQTAANLDIATARVADMVGASWWRQTLDDVFPGITNNSTAIAAGFGLYGLSQIAFYEENRYYRFAQHFRALNEQKGSAKPFVDYIDYLNPFKLFKAETLDMAYEAMEKVTNNLDPSDDLQKFKAAYTFNQWKKDTIPFETENLHLEKYLSETWDKNSGLGLWHKLERTVNALVAPTRYATMPIDSPYGVLLKSSHAKWKNITVGTAAFVAGLLGWKVATAGLIGRLQSADEISDEYSGRKLVEVRKSRWWGAGGNPYEGGKVSHYKPSLNALIQSDAQTKAIWGDDAPNPVMRFLLKNFTYHLEERNASSRPYPMSSPAFADVPFMGRLLGGTIGRIIKPIRYYREEEWRNGDSYLNVPDDKDSNPYIPDGGVGIGRPRNPYSFAEMFGKTQYNMREAEGFIGFLKNRFQSTFSGEETFANEGQLMAESGEMQSTIRDFWELELGGLASLSEIPRRFLPKERIQDRNRYNPILNDMPGWMPEKFKRGDPYTKVPVGYARLPGPGYAALHPELKGVAPENYPLANRYDILANVAYYSTEFRIARAQMKKAYDKGTLSAEHRELFEMREKEIDKLKLKRNYFMESDEQLQQATFIRMMRKMYLEGVENIKDMAAPIEYMTFGGIRPTQKFLPVGDALDDYERFAILGSETSFWTLDKAFTDYLGPAFQHLTTNLTGRLASGVPERVEKRRALEQYFDRLNYYKYMKLWEKYRAEGKTKEAARYKAYAHKTVFGVNKNAPILSQYSVMPTPEKDRFEGFRRISSPAERARLMELLPEDVKPMVQSIWNQQDGKKPDRSFVKGESDANKMAEVEAYLAQTGMPDEGWAGWNPHIDMNDVKIKYAQEMGYDPMDFGFWPQQVDMLNRKPYLEGVTEGVPYRQQVMRRLNRANSYGYNNVYKSTTDSGAAIVLNDNRESEIRREQTLWDSEN